MHVNQVIVVQHGFNAFTFIEIILLMTPYQIAIYVTEILMNYMSRKILRQMHIIKNT